MTDILDHQRRYGHFVRNRRGHVSQNKRGQRIERVHRIDVEILGTSKLPLNNERFWPRGYFNVTESFIESTRQNS